MIDLSTNGWLDVKNYLNSLKLSPGKRRQLHRMLARKVASFARQNTRDQTLVSGAPMQARAPQNPDYDQGKKRGKMLKKIARNQHMNAIGTEGLGKVYWSDALMGIIAARQQEGAVLKKSSRPRGNNRSGDEPATKAQALRLVRLGFERRVGKQYLKANPSWIQKNLTIDQASLLIRTLGGEQPRRERMVLPARPFLGVSPAQNQALSLLIFEWFKLHR